jgi:hypothetical protein
MLSKCANPACGAKFQYLGVGRVFVVEHRTNTHVRTSNIGSEFAQSRRDLRCFWLCPACSQSMTIQPSGAGGVRLAPSGSALPEDQGLPKLQELLSAPNPGWGCEVEEIKRKIDALLKELEFLDSGGYRLAMGWRPPLVFEDSPICPKPPCSACPDAKCVLLDFVPEDYRHEIVPCQHIPINQVGETLHTLYNTATMEEIENALREWLKIKIDELNQLGSSGAIPEKRTAA